MPVRTRKTPVVMAMVAGLTIFISRFESETEVWLSGGEGFFRNHPFFASNEIISVIKYWYQIKAVYDNEE